MSLSLVNLQVFFGEGGGGIMDAQNTFIYDQVAVEDPGFFTGGHQPLRAAGSTYYLTSFSLKLHENEQNFDPGGGGEYATGLVL